VSRVTHLKTLRWCLPNWHTLSHTHTHTLPHTGAYLQVNGLAKVAAAVEPAMQRGTKLRASTGMLRANIPRREIWSSTKSQGWSAAFSHVHYSSTDTLCSSCMPKSRRICSSTFLNLLTSQLKYKHTKFEKWYM